ncbi:transposase-like zinc-binding domain-containing protein [Scytonema sp. PCC 10023]|uniref:IS1/IS1595 family N-terminal zinc-binding domain-containing protein n=1 Tax=Scytonema sp. PCC 10023 TaxID=1680591 RepID=UPI0039C62579
MMQCPECGSTTVSKNGQRKGKQNYLCQVCQRQFIDTYEPKSYTPPGQRHLNLVDR